MQASHQWATRPDDERFTSLDDMVAHFNRIKNESCEVIVPSRRIHVLPQPDHKGLEIVGPNGHPYVPTHWSFGQIASLAEAPAGYLRTMPAEIAADCINYGLQFKRSIEDVGVLLHKTADNVPAELPGSVNTMRAATGPNYGRVWNQEIVSTLQHRFGDGVTGD
jgi:hypothetical protein